METRMPGDQTEANSSFLLHRSPPVVGIVGATGAVGRELLGVLERRRFPFADLRLFASPRSAGAALPFAGSKVAVEALSEHSLRDIDLALFSAGSGVSREYAQSAVNNGATVIDNSSAFRMDPKVPLVVPEINAEAIATHRGIIANPNCAAIIALIPLAQIHRHCRIRRAILATYQAASGGGAAAMQELLDATRAHLAGQAHTPRALPHPYAFNLFSHNTPIDAATGYNVEETKVIQEMRKILADPEIRIGVTCIRVPVLRAHAIAITIECERRITPAEARALLGDTPGVRLVDDRASNHFPMPSEASGQDDILVGRIRADVSDSTGHSLAFFVVGDQLLKGAALNAVQIAERLVGCRGVVPLAKKVSPVS
jgi:aspartate-semialdehyde dehydrogenase